MDAVYQQRLEFLRTLTPTLMLHELLAVIHGDGGHYARQHGLAKAVADAEELWHSLRGEVEELEAKYAKTLEAHLADSIPPEPPPERVDPNLRMARRNPEWDEDQLADGLGDMYRGR